MPQVRCPRCSTVVDYAAGFQPICPSCGFAGNGAGPTAAPPPAMPAPPAAPAAQRPPTQGIAIAALLLNVLVWPGLGTLVASRVGIGLAQGFLMLLGLLLTITILFLFVGIPLMVGMWVWGLITGIQLLQESNAAQAGQPRPA